MTVDKTEQWSAYFVREHRRTDTVTYAGVRRKPLVLALDFAHGFAQ